MSGFLRCSRCEQGFVYPGRFLPRRPHLCPACRRQYDADAALALSHWMRLMSPGQEQDELSEPVIDDRMQ